MKDTAFESEYKALHDEFIRTSAAMLWDYEESGSKGFDGRAILEGSVMRRFLSYIGR